MGEMPQNITKSKPGAYFITKIKGIKNQNLLDALTDIGFIEGQYIIVLHFSTKKDLYVTINEATYYIRKKLLKDVYVKKTWD